MAEEDPEKLRKSRTHVRTVQMRKDRAYVLFSEAEGPNGEPGADAGECTWEAWVASKGRWHLE